jgi:hypothetical protein
MINRANQIVANVLESKRREFGGVGWTNYGVVDIVLVRRGRRQPIAKTQSGHPPLLWHSSSSPESFVQPLLWGKTFRTG